ncbi:hypothetical protein [Rathayibacter sp. VKM Ac-2630]|uniref:hypothetical protein n=1 Tax=Rathayibacter sp. VKM Ac-2630 TaxID=1938617 RepID=UPI0009817F83|nr:hypothetical protein [Rathayibacter sp. VKM Ac-2630]OOB91830.1 hypothetical protein B0T42_03580 [Rathayibacter sp. VKM Ac-2630]
MRSRLWSPVVLACVLGVAGCSSQPVVDVPASAGAGATLTPTPIATRDTTPSSAGPALDCAAVLPGSRIEQDLGLPSGAAGLADDGRTCSYSLAGNPEAVVVTLTPARLLETFVGAGEAAGAVPVPLGEAAYQRSAPEGGTESSELAVLAGGYELRIVSFVGDPAVVVQWAETVFAAVGVRLVV